MRPADFTSLSTPTTRRGRHRIFLVLVFLLAAGTIIVAAALLYAPDFPASFVPSDSDGAAEAVFPLSKRYANSYGDDWGASRIQGKHEGTDVFAPSGTTIRSITDGTSVRARGSDNDGWNDLGGYTVMVRASEEVGPIERGDLLYYAHMNGATDLEIGEEIEAGQKIGAVGDTGQGPEGTRGEFRSHLHVGWYEGQSLVGEERSEAESGAMNPYPLLRWIEQHNSRTRDSEPDSRQA